MQYKHSGLASRTFDVAVSTMNSEVSKLHNGWQDRKWIFLWVTNRTVVEDADPDSSLGVQSHSRGACSSTWLSWACATGNSQTPG